MEVGGTDRRFLGRFIYVSGVEGITAFIVSYLFLILIAVVKVRRRIGGRLRGLK